MEIRLLNCHRKRYDPWCRQEYINAVFCRSWLKIWSSRLSSERYMIQYIPQQNGISNSSMQKALLARTIPIFLPCSWGDSHLSQQYFRSLWRRVLRLRRAVLHPNLVLTPDDERALSPAGDGTVDVNDMIQRFADSGSTGEGGKNSFAEEVLANLADAEASECPICFDVMETPMFIPECMHQW